MVIIIIRSSNDNFQQSVHIRDWAHWPPVGRRLQCTIRMIQHVHVTSLKICYSMWGHGLKEYTPSVSCTDGYHITRLCVSVLCVFLGFFLSVFCCALEILCLRCVILCYFECSVAWLFWLGCQYQCKWLTGKTRLRRELQCVMRTLNPTHSPVVTLTV